MAAHEVGIAKDNWTKFTEKQERKKRQNRLNQRALRQRKNKNEIRIVSGKRPYRVSHWRIGQPQEQHDMQLSSVAVDASLSSSPLDDDTTWAVAHVVEHSAPEPKPNALLALVQKTDFSPKTTYQTPPASIDFPLSSDHLIRLIHQNVFSALMGNKSLLTQTTYITKPTV
jgi:hypothetical protein